MDSATSKSVSHPPKPVTARRAARMMPVERGHGIHLVATCLLNAPTSRMSVSEIYEWLAEKYPRYQFTKNKLRRLFSGPPPTQHQFPQFYGGLSQQIYCVLCKLSFDRYETFATHQQQAHFGHETTSPPADEAPHADQSFASTSTWHSPTGDLQPFEDELSATGHTFEAADRNEVVQSPNVASRGNGPLQQRLLDSPSGSTNHTLYIKAAIASARGIVELTRVKIDGTSLHNLLPRSIARKLRLPLHFGGSVRARLANRTVLTDQYCQFTIKVAGIKTAIDAYVVSGLSSLLLGREWTQQVNLLSDLGNYTYYIPGPNGNLNELPIPGPITDTEAETEYVMEAAMIREETLPAEETPTPLRGDGDKDCRLDESASVDSTTGDETMSDAEFFADAVSCQSSDDELFYIDRRKGTRRNN
ncbi:hypothetical protein BJ875DRAFT_444023 [Amylocarpus encephaloides]|uniref:C2H2-type domain-containing protein n=1 Tax=Amylocarpus encephaloides TaxID=45428 RepID=A0A9P7YD65_9HELO|nr:hypothetical protein BJ875DRAFT_444023 [Amylocarpus encephaloides]